MDKKKILSGLIIIFFMMIASLNCIVRVYNLASYKNLIYLLIRIGVVSLLFGAILFVLKKGRYVMIFSAIFLIMLFISNSLSISIINKQRQSVFDNGIRIVNALSSYYKDNNKYPEDLKELMPKYIDSIPKIKTSYYEGEFLYYVKDEGKSYYLGFEHYYFDGKGWLELE
ncbi:hypothetical protein [Acetivibrio mesophilus]|uniref:Type II secretion system protein GspG C-terminal domain-containing protein n=1 Tax=Acetivibrio mesophilus TaxID=2487273 RepID=A0A4Q0I420_9FIRM|nr:hypothetical protein [Acetivibrio mesophilus]ODM27833.1 hypothetical protein A7W90_17325 [Clostridium sp. Bc-iso-3]RXE59033.1 hypothetical protein EFD62_09580 [Acetivibrio mesophilus]HHV30624.1 hypothetical protein [Clostridium sp.]